MTEFDVVVAGHICYDIIPSFEVRGVPDMAKLFAPGKLVNMGPMSSSSGGPVSNTGLGMQILGIDARFMGKVGNDFLGRGLLERLEKYNASDSMVVVDGEQTSYTIVLVPGDVDRIFLHHPGANNTYGSDDVNYDVVAGARHFHLGYPPLMKKIYSNDGAELVKIFKNVKELGVTTSIDMSLPDPDSESGRVNWKKVMTDLLPYVDIALPSGEEAMFMLRPDEFKKKREKSHGSEALDFFTADELESLGDEIISLGSKIAVIKLGHRGIYLRTADKAKLSEMGNAQVGDPDNWHKRQLWEEAFMVEKVASATGSGDSAIAGFLSAFLRGLSVEESIKTACCTGGQNVQVMDAVSGIHSWQETKAMIPGWKKRRQDIKADGWQYDETGRLWIGPRDKQ